MSYNYERRKAAGLCTECGRPHKEKTVRCGKCTEKHRAKQARYYANIWAKEQVEVKPITQMLELAAKIRPRSSLSYLDIYGRKEVEV